MEQQMATTNSITTLAEVAGHLRSLLTGDAIQDAALAASIVVCERAIRERTELLKAVQRLSKRLAVCSKELTRAMKDLS